MLAYIIMSKNKMQENNLLGVFDEYEKALLKSAEYAQDNPEEKCWIETFEMNIWLYETGAEYKIVHRTMVSKTLGINSHVITVSKENVQLLEETEDWYIIQQVNQSFDKKEGLEQNLHLLKEYLAKKKVKE